MAVTPLRDGWQPLDAADLPYLGAVWRQGSGGPRIDPHLLWWDLTAGRALAMGEPAAREAPQPLMVLVQAQADGPMASPRGSAQQRGDAGREARGPGIVTRRVVPDELAGLVTGAHRVLLGPDAVPVVEGLAAPLHKAAGHGVLLGIVDDGCAFLNACFRRPVAKGTAWESRVRWLWDQGRGRAHMAGGSWCATHFAYGAELTRRGFEQACRVARHSGESAGYGAIGYLVDAAGALPVVSHGTFMAAIAGGDLDRIGLWGAEGGGAANQSELAVVALPRAAIDDTSGHSLAVHLLDGVNWILSKAAPGQPVVVNLSLAYYGGPHDGSDLLRTALGELVQREWEYNQRPLTLVTGAGNAYEAGLHAQWLDHADGIPADTAASWWWDVPAGDPTDSFLNIWSQGALDLRLLGPSGLGAVDMATGQGFALWRDGRVIGLAVNLANSAQGDGHHIHLALAPTNRQAPAGRWAVEVRNRGRVPCWFDAWVDRDDAPLGSVGTPRAPSRLRDREGWPAVVSPERSLNALAGDSVLVAAAAMRRGRMSRYSGEGGRRGSGNDRPFVAMATDEDDAMPGLPGPTPASAVVTRVSGTSVSSALLSREVVDSVARTSRPAPASLTELKARLSKELILPAAADPQGGPKPDPLRAGSGRSLGRLRRRDRHDDRIRSP